MSEVTAKGDANEEKAPTATVEDYLGEIYIQSAEGQAVKASLLAQRLGVSLPTVLATVKRMARDGLVDVDGHREITLTPEGDAAAQAITRRHRLVERLLLDVLGLEWHEVHEEASRLEHAISPKLEEKLRIALARPMRCPHGNPIPGSGATKAPDEFPLDKVTEGQAVIVERIREDAESDPELLRYLQQIGLAPGVRLLIKQVVPSAGMIIMRRGDQDVSLGLQRAVCILVRPAGG